MRVCIGASGVCVVYTWRSEDNSRLESVRLPPCRFPGSNAGRRAWLQAPVPAQPPPRQLLISPSSSVPPRPSGHLLARCEPARERQVRAVPSRHAHRAAPRTRRSTPLSAGLAGLRKAKFPPRPEGGVAERHGAPRTCGLRGKQKPRAGERAATAALRGTLERSAGRSASHAGPRPPARPIHAIPGKPREGRQKRDREHGTGSGVRRRARAPHPRGHGARTCRRRRRRRRVPRSASLRRERRSARPAGHRSVHTRSVAQPRAGHRRRRLAAPASRLVRRAAPAVVPPPPAAGPTSHRATGLPIRPQKARGLSLRPSRLVAVRCLCK